MRAEPPWAQRGGGAPPLLIGTADRSPHKGEDEAKCPEKGRAWFRPSGGLWWGAQASREPPGRAPRHGFQPPTTSSSLSKVPPRKSLPPVCAGHGITQSPTEASGPWRAALPC